MKILIIEDSERLRRTLVIGLKNLGYIVEESGDGVEGLNYALTNTFDLIILDLMLPSIDGLSILKKLRVEKKNTPVLILSAKDQLEDKVKGLNEGADDYLCKPFSFDELEARIKSLIRRSKQVSSSLIDIGDLSIDMDLKKSSVKGQDLSLTPHEYKLLVLLVLNHGKVMSYESIENNTYDFSAEITKNTIEAHISSLRKKLKSHQLDDMIKTRRGFGYYIDSI